MQKTKVFDFFLNHIVESRADLRRKYEKVSFWDVYRT